MKKRRRPPEFPFRMGERKQDRKHSKSTDQPCFRHRCFHFQPWEALLFYPIFFSNQQLNYVHPSVEKVLGGTPQNFSFEYVFAQMHLEDASEIQLKERAAIDFFYNKICAYGRNTPAQPVEKDWSQKHLGIGGLLLKKGFGLERREEYSYLSIAGGFLVRLSSPLVTII
jgi:hypothetical protein